MYKIPIKKICAECNKEFYTKNPLQRCCCKICTKRNWAKRIKILGHNITDPSLKVGRRKGCIPWNKNKKCPQLQGVRNGFYNKHHTQESIRIAKEKAYKTKKRNNSFQTSKIEDVLYEKLCNKFTRVIRQYKSEKYPFNCDFYIPEKDLYIEYQGHWTHGIDNHKILGLYDPNNLYHQQVLLKWKNKNTKYFDRAIKTWTELDPLKQKYIDSNKLYFLKFFTLEEFMEWYNKLE